MTNTNSNKIPMKNSSGSLILENNKQDENISIDKKIKVYKSKIVLDDIQTFVKNNSSLFIGLDINDSNLIEKIEDKYIVLPGQIVELKLYDSGTVPVIVTKVHPKDENGKDENGHNAYDCVLFLTGSMISTIHTKERYLWRFLEKKGNVKRLKNFIDNLIQKDGDNLKYLSTFFEDRDFVFYIAENGKISTISFNKE